MDLDGDDFEPSNNSVVLLDSDDDEQDENQPIDPDSLEILTSPKEALVNLHPEILNEAKVVLTFFMGLPQKKQPKIPTSVDIAVGTTSLEAVSVNINKSRSLLKFSCL